MRRATLADSEQILRYLYDYYRENQEKLPINIDFDLEECWGFLRKALEHPSVISYITDGGVIMGELGHPWFGKTPIAKGVAWYVEPESRNGIMARSLMRAFDNEAQERGARFIQQPIDNGTNIKMIAPLMKRLGYEDYSKIFIKRL